MQQAARRQLEPEATRERWRPRLRPANANRRVCRVRKRIEVWRDEEKRLRKVVEELNTKKSSVERSAVFRKSLADRLALTQILFIVGLPWIGVAAKQGPSHIILWLLAMLLFYIPSAVVVTYLNRIMPLEGGLYQWAKLGFNELLGFLVAWNLWLFAILNTSEIGLQIAQYVGYIVGPSGEWLTGSKWFIGAMSFATIAP
jgi:amino acid transporter